MCFGSKKSDPAPAPAPAPAAPLPSPDEPDIGASRRRESRDNFDGDTAPDYRVKRTTGQTSVQPGGQITM
jgi:hypothetical protein